MEKQFQTTLKASEAEMQFLEHQRQVEQHKVEEAMRQVYSKKSKPGVKLGQGASKRKKVQARVKIKKISQIDSARRALQNEYYIMELWGFDP